MLKRTRAIVEAGAVALVIGALAFVGTSQVLNRSQNHQTGLGDVLLTASQNFTITSSISSSSSTQNATTLYPGVQRYLWYTVHNPLHAPIKVLSLGAALDPAYPLPAGCDATNLDLSGTSLTGTVGSPIVTVNALSTGTAAAPIKLVNKTGPTGNQDACKNVTFHFKYSGSAQYTEVFSTSTALASSQNPSTVGQAVTYTATVTGIVGSGQDPLPNGPTGTVTFKDGATTICSSVAVTVGVTTSTATCPVTYASTAGSPHSITAVYSNSDGNFTGSTGGPLSQVVNAALPGTSTVLTSAPNPSIQGTTVTLTATVTKSSGSGTPTGTVTFFTGTPASPGTNLGNGTLNSSGKATLTTSTLPVGTTSLFAKYNGSASFAASTSAAITQTVVALPANCPSGTYNLVVGNPSSPSINSGNGNDFIYAPGSTNWTINGGNGNDCIQAGDGNNTITDGNGNDVVLAGNGTNTITVGNGTDKVVAGNGKNTITAGNGANSITVGNGSNNKITAGNGSNTIVMGTGANNSVTLGNGANTITIQTPGNHNTITVGNGKNTAFLGGGTFNKFTGGKSGNTCHLPSLPASAYNDTLVNCTAVTP